jgi:uncharacterized repeat protein (TIGR01451 family)
MVRSMTKRGMPKPFAILIAALMALYFVPLGALPASAATVGGFEIEGNLVDDTAADPPIDWFDLNPGDAGFATDVDNVDNSGQDTTTFKGASKEFNLQNESGGWPGWQFGSGNATGKSDFGRWATYTNTDANSHVWFFLGFDRGFGTGTAKYAFELNQIIQSPTTEANPTRSQGDLRLIVFDQGNGLITLTADAQNPDVGLYTWDDPDQAAGGVAEDTDNDGVWVKVQNAGTFVGASNTGADPVAVPSWWTSGNVVNGTLTKDTFLEFGIDLTSFGAVLGCPSQGFTAVNARSITGTGGPGTLVDYLAALPVHIPSTCTSLVTNATNQVVIGNSISDTATITPSNATGTVTFKVYGPNDATCANAPIATLGPITVVNGTASSGPYTPTAVGTYRWIASYDSNDDAHFADSVGKCNDPNEQSAVVKTKPAITTTAGSSGTLPGAVTISDVAHLTGLTATAGGDVTFKAYGPFPASSSPTCTGTATTVVVALGTVGADHVIDVESGPVTVTHAGKYYWVASYSGDANNEAVAGTCGDANETSVVDSTQPEIVTLATGGSLPVGSVSDTADLSGVTADAGGTIVFELFASPDCDGDAIFTSDEIAVDGPDTYGPVTTTVDNAGSYYWIATYTGDDNNDGVAGECGDEGETSVVTPASPVISTVAVATDPTVPTTSVQDTATLTGLSANATGSVTFRIYSNSTCTTLVATLGPVAIGTVTGGTATVFSGAYTGITAAGDYFFVASYSGDGNNNAVAGRCGDANEVVHTGALVIVKAVSPVAGNGVVVEFGDTLTYTLTVNATGTLSQPNVVVNDYIPGYDPARPTSGKTTYVAGSATCIGAGTCTVTGPDASHQLTWSLGTMAGGTSRQVTFKVTIDDVTGAAGETVAVDILNAGAVKSDLVPKTPSNQVVTPVSKVLPVKISKPPVVVLPHTGLALPVGTAVGGAMALLGLGLLLMAAGRRRSWLPRG